MRRSLPQSAVARRKAAHSSSGASRPTRTAFDRSAAPASRSGAGSESAAALLISTASAFGCAASQAARRCAAAGASARSCDQALRWRRVRWPARRAWHRCAGRWPAHAARVAAVASAMARPRPREAPVTMQSFMRASLPDAYPMAKGAGLCRLHRPPVHRVRQGQRRGMQQQARAGDAVEIVADDRVADGLQVHAQLVRAPGDGLQFHEAVRSPPPLQARARRSAPLGRCTGSTCWRGRFGQSTTRGRSIFAGVVGHPAFDHGDIGLVHAPSLEGQAEPALRLRRRAPSRTGPRWPGRAGARPAHRATAPARAPTGSRARCGRAPTAGLAACRARADVHRCTRATCRAS
jgi:hypothetical protein